MRDRLAAESPQEREARLQQMRDRLVTESPEGRDSRPQNMIILQRHLRPLKKGKFDCNVPLVVPTESNHSLSNTLLKQYHSHHFYQLHMLRLAPNRCPASSLAILVCRSGWTGQLLLSEAVKHQSLLQ